MMTALVDRTSRPAALRSGARKERARSKSARRPAPSAQPVSDTKDTAAVAADVMAVLAAFGLED